MKPPSASNLLYTLGRKPTAIITEVRLQKWNKAWTSSTPFTPTNLYFILVCVCVCVLGANVFVLFRFISVCVSFSLFFFLCEIQFVSLWIRETTKTCISSLIQIQSQCKPWIEMRCFTFFYSTPAFATLFVRLATKFECSSSLPSGSDNGNYIRSESARLLRTYYALRNDAPLLSLHFIYLLKWTDPLKCSCYKVFRNGNNKWFGWVRWTQKNLGEKRK